jgi:hypothetical protein
MEQFGSFNKEETLQILEICADSCNNQEFGNDDVFIAKRANTTRDKSK